MDTSDEASEYDAMDHSEPNTAFVADAGIDGAEVVVDSDRHMSAQLRAA